MRKRIFKRKVYDKMEWKRERNGSSFIQRNGKEVAGKYEIPFM